MKKQTCSDILSGLRVCHEAVTWVKASKCRSLETAWKKCERGDWMLWYAGKLSGPVGNEKRKLLVLASCACARLSLPLFEKRYPDDKRVRDCIETAEKWARGEATVEALQVARRNCYAYAAATAEATYAAEAAAEAASDATYAASAASAAARKKTLKECADIVRGFYPDRGFTVRASYLKDVPESKGDALIEIFRDGQPLRAFLFPAYKIYNIAAHFRDIVDGELEGDESGYQMAAWDGISGAVILLPQPPRPPPPQTTHAGHEQ